ncbi:MAG: serine hydrolase [Vulcanimicrobiaceae bacterium]
MHINSLGVTPLAALAQAAGLGPASIIVERLDAHADVEATATLRPSEPIYPASMIKLPIAMVLAGFCEAGAYAWTDDADVSAANMTSNDAPSPFRAGGRAELGELAHAMLAASDNVATNVLIDVLGRETITRACHAFGLSRTVVARKLSGSLPLIDDPDAAGRNAHPAADAARLLRLVARDAARKPNVVARALEAQLWNDKLSRGLAPGDAFAHKTGDTDEVSHDGGILTLANGRRYIVVVYTQLPANPETDACFAAFMRALRPQLGA